MEVREAVGPEEVIDDGELGRAVTLLLAGGAARGGGTRRGALGIRAPSAAVPALASLGCWGIHSSLGAVQSLLQWPVLPHL